MNKLNEIKEYVEREYWNLCKSRQRPRTQVGIDEKKYLLSQALKDFVKILEDYENKIPIEDWNRLTDDLIHVRKRVDLSLKILHATVVIPSKRRGRSNSEYCLEIVIPAYTERNS